MTLSAKRQNCPQPTFSSVNHAKGSILKTFEHCPHEREERLPTYIPNLESLIKLFQPSTVIKHLFYPTQPESWKWSCKQVVMFTVIFMIIVIIVDIVIIMQDRQDASSTGPSTFSTRARVSGLSIPPHHHFPRSGQKRSLLAQKAVSCESGFWTIEM